LFEAKNKEGLLAIEIAEQLSNYACVQTLQVFERHAVYQNALYNKKIKSKKHKPQTQKSARQYSSSNTYSSESEGRKNNLNIKNHVNEIQTQRER
jgi:hypothetical protein